MKTRRRFLADLLKGAVIATALGIGTAEVMIAIDSFEEAHESSVAMVRVERYPDSLIRRSRNTTSEEKTVYVRGVRPSSNTDRYLGTFVAFSETPGPRLELSSLANLIPKQRLIGVFLPGVHRRVTPIVRDTRRLAPKIARFYELLDSKTTKQRRELRDVLFGEGIAQGTVIMPHWMGCLGQEASESSRVLVAPSIRSPQFRKRIMERPYPGKEFGAYMLLLPTDKLGIVQDE